MAIRKWGVKTSIGSIDRNKYEGLSEAEKLSLLDEQREVWDKAFISIDNMFEKDESYAARVALRMYEDEDFESMLELGPGQGRDSVYFKNNHIPLSVLDYSEEALRDIRDKAKELDYRGLKTYEADVREGLPFEENTFDMVYSHMLYCMAFTDEEIMDLHREINRILTPGGINIFTVRSDFDKHFKKGSRIDEGIYEINNFIIHFFDEDMIRSMAENYKILNIHRFQEGELPRDLYFVAMQKIK